MQKSDSKALSAIGDFLVALAERVPSVVLRHMAFLSPLHDGAAALCGAPAALCRSRLRVAALIGCGAAIPTLIPTLRS